MTDQALDHTLLARDNYNRFASARDRGHAEYVSLSKRCNEYYQGNQWADADIAKLNTEGRPYLTINEILPTVNTVLGQQALTRSDAQFKPRADGDTSVAAALNKVYLQIYDSNHMEWVESAVFADGVIGGRGYFDVRMDFSDNIAGTIHISAEDPHNILIDPDAKDYDPKTWKEVFKTKWLSVDDIELLYGKEAAERIRYMPEDYTGLGVDSVLYEESFGADAPQSNSSGEEDRRQVRSIRVIERQYRKLRRVRVFVDNTTGDLSDIPDDFSDKRVKQMAQRFDLSVIWQMRSAIRWVVSADNFILFDDWSPYQEFTIVPFFAYFRRGRPFGVVENLLSPQDNLNKVASQELHVVNTTANSGWTFESGTLVGMDRDDLARDGSKTGLVVEHARGSTAPAKIQPNQIPTGLDRISMKAAQFVRDISGVSESMLGYDGNEVSGVAIERKQSRGMVQLQPVFDNLNRTRHLLAERILELVQRFYTEERMIRITEYSAPEPTEQELVVNQMTPEGTVLNDLTLGTYDVVITSVPARDSFNDSQFAEALSLRNVGVMVPDDAIVQYSNLAHKAELAQRMRDMAGLGEPSDEEIAIQQELQAIEMQRLNLELSELEGKARSLMAQAQLNEAKAAELLQGGDDGDADGQKAGVEQALRLRELAAEQKAERDRLDTELTIKREQFANQLRIAEMSERTKLKVAQMNSMAQRLAAREKGNDQTGSGKERKRLASRG